MCPSATPSRRQERRLRKTKLILPEYSQLFRCIGPACEDTCSQGWSVPIDQAAFEKYPNLPASPVRTLIDASMLSTPESAKPGNSATGVPPKLIASFQGREITFLAPEPPAWMDEAPRQTPYSAVKLREFFEQRRPCGLAADGDPRSQRQDLRHTAED